MWCRLFSIVSYGGPVTSFSFHSKGNGWTSALGRGTALSTTRTAQLSLIGMVPCPVPVCQQATHKYPARTHCPHVLVVLLLAIVLRHVVLLVRPAIPVVSSLLLLDARQSLMEQQILLLVRRHVMALQNHKNQDTHGVSR